jgi:hypothetical protein
VITSSIEDEDEDEETESKAANKFMELSVVTEDADDGNDDEDAAEMD